MADVVESMVSWATRWNSDAAPASRVEVHLGDAHAHKRAAWLLVDGHEIIGQLTVWETGECELEAYRVSDGAAMLLEHRDLGTDDDIETACEEIVTVCGLMGPPSSPRD